MTFAMPSALDLDGAPARPHPHVRPHAQKGVAADLLSALRRFQQKSVRLFFSDGKEGRNRREQIGTHRFHYRHQRRRTRQPRELSELWMEHAKGEALSA